jgi:hypothetical protein
VICVPFTRVSSFLLFHGLVLALALGEGRRITSVLKVLCR